VTAGEDKEEAKDKVGGAVGTASPSCKRFKYSRSVGARTSGAYHTAAARRPSPPAQWEDDDKVGCRQCHRNGRQRRETFDGGDGRCNGNAIATAMEGATVMRQRRRLKAQQRCNGDNGDNDGRRNRATAVAAMVSMTIAMAAEGKTTIN
jgi:hypothetical protein